MSDRIFFDTNILVYAFDASDLNKHDRSAELIRAAFEHKNGTISTQVLQEFFVVATRKLEKNLSVDEARDIIQDFSVWPVVEITVPMILQAVGLVKSRKFSFWDSLIISAAKRASCTVLYTEDLSHAQTFDGMKIINPFLLPPSGKSNPPLSKRG